MAGFLDFLGDVGGGIWDFATNEDNAPLLSGIIGALGTAGQAGAFGDGVQNFLSPQAPQAGYQGGIPRYTAVRAPISYDDTNRRPGSAGRRYFTDTTYATPDNLPQAMADTEAQAQSLGNMGELSFLTGQSNSSGQPLSSGAGQPSGSMEDLLAALAALGLGGAGNANGGTGNTGSGGDSAPVGNGNTGTPASGGGTSFGTPTEATDAGVNRLYDSSGARSDLGRGTTRGVINGVFQEAFGRYATSEEIAQINSQGLGYDEFLNSIFGGRRGSDANTSDWALNESSLNALYEEILGRPVGQEGLNYWLNGDHDNWTREQFVETLQDSLDSAPVGEGIVGGRGDTNPDKTPANPSADEPSGLVTGYGDVPETGPSWAIEPIQLTNVEPNKKIWHFNSDGNLVRAVPSSQNLYTVYMGDGHFDRYTNEADALAARQLYEAGLPQPQGFGAGGQIKKYAQGGGIGSADAASRYIRGSQDGMADQIPASIDGSQPAALSAGEFVVPADVVSHLGNGNSDAGAEQLYSMMDRIRQARTGQKEQAKPINPEEMMPMRKA
jgi:hypothetical protein